MYIHESVSCDAVLKFLDGCKQHNVDIHAFEIYEDNQLMVRCSAYPYSCEDKRQIYSLSKSFASTAIGFLADENLVSVEDRVIDIFPDMVPENISENLKAMKVKHLLSMNTGHEQCQMPSVRDSDDGVRSFLSREIKYKPGTHFTYNTGATYMLSAIINKITGLSLYDYLNIKFFLPLGITNVHWNILPGGINEGGVGLHASCDDVAKMALFYLNEGMWEGKQLLSKEWVKQATKLQSDNSENGTSDWSSGYGYQFWMNDREGYRGDGAFGQLAMVFPKRNMVVTYFAYVEDMQKEVNIVYDMAFSLHGDSKGTKEDVLNVLKSYHAPLGTNKKIHCDNNFYKCDNNALGITFVSFQQSENWMTMSLSDGERTQDILCGNGEFKENNIYMKNMKPTLIDLSNPGSVSHLRFVSSYTIADGKIIIALRYLNTPHTETITCSFLGDDIVIRFTDKERTILEEAAEVRGTLYKK